MLTISSSAMLTSHDIVLQDGLVGDLEHHTCHMDCCSIAQFQKDAHRQDLLEEGTVFCQL